MKKLGILGGAGPLASSLFYETLVQHSYFLGLELGEIFLINYPFTRGLTPQEGKSHAKHIHEQLQYCFDVLERNEIQDIVLVCNTLHLSLEAFPESVKTVHSIPQLVLKEIRKQKAKRLLLLATQNTCRSYLYKNQEHVLVIPSKEQQQVIDNVINHVLEGEILERDAYLITQIIEHYFADIDGVILGCTDLPVLHHRYPFDCQKSIYDSVKLPAKLILGNL